MRHDKSSSTTDETVSIQNNNTDTPCLKLLEISTSVITHRQHPWLLNTVKSIKKHKLKFIKQQLIAQFAD